ncbi:MAG: amino acid carrier protein [Verrucomicrobiaceae bacterium]|nr:amino acid carrier protein [Verrucomicrobiaceae bacterium]
MNLRIFLCFTFLLLVLSQGDLTFGQELAPDAEPAAEKPIDAQINDLMAGPTKAITTVIFFAVPVAGVQIPLVLVWLAFAAIFFTFYFKFVNLSSFGLAVRTIKGRYSKPDDPGEITHFQALTAALSGTVGLGNIAGVAIAIQLGGPGATFWMILMGLFGMTSKFVECTLGVKYRDVDATGKVHGGPMRYLSKGLKERGQGQLGLILAMFFAVMCIGGSFGGGNIFQINSATTQFIAAFGGGEGSFLDQQRWVFGLLIAIVVGAVIIGGIKSIGKVTATLVPFMCGIYILAILVVLVMNLGKLPGAFGSIISGAFNPGSIGGGLIGCMLLGIKRAAFSNEAGVGSAAIAHSAVKTTKPASEGFVALLEPFVDTVVVCTMTALAIIVTGVYSDPNLEGVAMTSAAFETAMPWFKMILSLAVILFAFSTMISWSYYGMQAWAFLFGDSKFMDLAYKFISCFFITVGSSMSLGNVVDFSDAMIFAMAIPNIIGLYILLPLVRGELDTFRAHVAEVDSKS